MKSTNIEMIPILQKVRKITATHRNVIAIEIPAFIEILTFTAVKKDIHLSTDELFDTTFIGTPYISVMSRKFEFSQIS